MYYFPPLLRSLRVDVLSARYSCCLCFQRKMAALLTPRDVTLTCVTSCSLMLARYAIFRPTIPRLHSMYDLE